MPLIGMVGNIGQASGPGILTITGFVGPSGTSGSSGWPPPPAGFKYALNADGSVRTGKRNGVEVPYLEKISS